MNPQNKIQKGQESKLDEEWERCEDLGDSSLAQSIFGNLMDGCAYHQMLFDDDDTPIDYVFLEINKKFEEFTGLKREEILGKRVTQVIPEITEAKPDLIAIYGKVAQSGEGTKLELFFEPFEKWYYVSVFCPRKGYFAVMFEDITLRKQIEMELHESEEKYRELANSLPQVVFEMDLRGNITYVNRHGFELFGFSREEFEQGLKATDMLSPEDRERGSMNIQRILAGEKIGGQEYNVPTKEGKTIPVLIYSTPIIHDETPVGLRGIVVDITDNKRAEIALRESEERYRSFVQNFPGIAYRSDFKFKPFFFHGAVEEITGYTAEEFTNQSVSWDKIIHPDDFPEVIKHIEPLSTIPGYAISLEYRIIHKDGDVRLVSEVGGNICDASGLPTYFDGFIDDITHRKQMEDSLQESEEHFRNVFENALVGLYRTSPDGRVLMANSALVDMMGYDSFMELAQRNLEQTGYPADYPRSNFKDLIEKDGQVIGFESDWVKRDGEILFVRESARAVRGKDGKTLYYEGTVEDITARKQAEDELKAKSQFLERLVHQSPLSTFVLDSEGICVMLNKAFLDLYHVPDENLILGGNALTLQANIEHGVVKYIKKALDGEIVEAPEIEFTSPFADKPVYVYSKLFPIHDPSGHLTNVVVVQKDITERKRAEEKIKESEIRYRAIFEQAAESLVLVEAETGAIVEFNEMACETLGYTREEFRKLMIPDFEVIESPEEVKMHIEKILEEGSDTFESKHRTKDGEIRNVLAMSKSISLHGKDYIQSIWYDITDRKKAEEDLNASLWEKEILLKEIHHRVKNNLQIITSLLDLQSDTVKNEELMQLYRESQNRIQTMAQIHEELYSSGDLAKIDVGHYIQNLVDRLQDSYGLFDVDLEIEVVTDDFSFNLDTAIPCGLIINEIVSNAMKHGFPEEWINQRRSETGEEIPKGRILVELREGEEGNFNLTVRDNGIGLPHGIDLQKTESLGLQLVDMLTQQLNGKIEVNGTKGTEFRITFHERNKSRVKSP